MCNACDRRFFFFLLLLLLRRSLMLLSSWFPLIVYWRFFSSHVLGFPITVIRLNLARKNQILTRRSRFSRAPLSLARTLSLSLIMFCCFACAIIVHPHPHRSMYACSLCYGLELRAAIERLTVISIWLRHHSIHSLQHGTNQGLSRKQSERSSHGCVYSYGRSTSM